MSWRTLGSVLLLVALATSARAELAPEPVGVSETVPRPEPHWTFYTDFELSNFHGRLVLIDADDAEFLAHVSTGQFPGLAIAPDASELYVSETTYARSSRGERHDFVTVYDTTHYAAQTHIELPTGKRAIMAARNRMALLRDARFLVLYNYTPATSLSVVDLKARKHLYEHPVPGCHLVYPTGERGVSMLCGDGRMLTVQLDADGRVASEAYSEPFFDPDADPLKTNAARIGDTWYFVSYRGDVYPVDLSGDAPRFEAAWPLVDHDAREANLLVALFTMGKTGRWLPGGMQLAAAHERRGELYVIMHPTLWSGGKGDHDFPGPEIWVFDVATKRKLRELSVRGVAASVGVTQDDAPLLLVTGANIRTEELHLEIYDALSGEFQREMFEFGDTPFSFDPVLGANAMGGEGAR